MSWLRITLVRVIRSVHVLFLSPTPLVLLSPSRLTLPLPLLPLLNQPTPLPLIPPVLLLHPPPPPLQPRFSASLCLWTLVTPPLGSSGSPLLSCLSSPFLGRKVRGRKIFFVVLSHPSVHLIIISIPSNPPK